MFATMCVEDGLDEGNDRLTLAASVSPWLIVMSMRQAMGLLLISRMFGSAPLRCSLGC